MSEGDGCEEVVVHVFKSKQQQQWRNGVQQMMRDKASVLISRRKSTVRNVQDRVQVMVNKRTEGERAIEREVAVFVVTATRLWLQITYSAN